MADPNSINTTIFEGIGGAIEKATEVFVSDVALQMIATIMPWVVAGVGLFITLYSYQIMGGKVQQPIPDFFAKCFKIVIVTSVALALDLYLEWVVETLKAIESTITSAIAGSKGRTTFQNLDAFLSKGMKLLHDCIVKARQTPWKEMGDMFGWYIVGAVHAASFSILALVGGVAIIIATVMLKIMFAIGPLFIICLLWPATTRFFDSWLGQVLTFIMQIALAASVLAISLSVFDQIIISHVDVSGNSSQNICLVALEAILAGIILYKIFREILGMAGQLGGGISSAATGIGQLASGAMAPVKAAQKAYSRVLNPQRTRRDVKTGMPVTASRASHFLHGNTILNPAYQQAVMNNLKGRWGSKKGGSMASA